MSKRFDRYFWMTMATLFLIVNSGMLLAQPGGEVGEAVQKFKELREEKEAEGADVSEALKLDEQSREAGQRGDQEKCLRLLKEAIALLEKAGENAEKGEAEIFERSEEMVRRNLLVNPGFEKGKNEPEGWTKYPFPLDEVVYKWDNKTSVIGKYSVSIENKSKTTSGMWRQVVPVTPEAVYILSGYVKFKGIPISRPGPSQSSKGPKSGCNLQLVFRNKNEEEIKSVDFPDHTGTRDFSYDFPRELRVRAPEDAASAEVNLVLAGQGKVWFDEVLFATVPAGDISGAVTSNGKAVDGVHVVIWGDPWGKEYKVLTDKNGKYLIKDVPVASPRYILLASKEGYKTIPMGRVDVKPEGVTEVNFEIKPGKDPKDDLRVKFGSMALCKRIAPRLIPRDALIPKDETGYPSSVRPFLKPDECIDCDHPSIKKLAAKILESVPVAKRASTYDVAYAVYIWNAKNIEHDGVYVEGSNPRASQEERVASVNENFKDVTGGLWQTITAEGWSWGRNLYDWLYRPSESLTQKGIICIEEAWLRTALFRALNIPARASTGSGEIWVQSPSGEGFWVHLAGGRTGYRKTGALQGFDKVGPILSFSVLSRPLVHEDWDMKKRGLWREVHPFGEEYEYSDRGLEQAVKNIEEFKKTGKAPRNTFRPRRSGRPLELDEAVQSVLPPERMKEVSHYLMSYSDITVSLLGIDQQKLDVRFPFISEHAGATYAGHEAYWTNHPECVVKTWVEEITNPPVEGKERWFHIEFDLAPLLE